MPGYMTPVVQPGNFVNPNAVAFQDDEIMRRVLLKNRHLDFVRRALNPSQYPVIEKDRRLPPGSRASHQMSWTSIENGPMKGKHIVYPNIVFDRRKKKLRWLEPKWNTL
jgi:hypothetical protein